MNQIASNSNDQPPPWGSVVLDNFMADDLSVINSARVSFGKRSQSITDADKGLINFLMRERHGTPFEHNAFRFIVRAPLFVAREWFRHRVGWSYNELSARYSQIPDEFYVPDISNVRAQTGKPGAYTFEPMSGPNTDEALATLRDSQSHSYRTYSYLLSLGVAKELARTVLPVGMFTEFYATCNARSLMHFISLRNHETAQYEIRQAAEQVETYFARAMPITYGAFIANGRFAP